ncbi:MAG: IS200/IS605 family transposase [Balneolaceae bacterium]
MPKTFNSIWVHVVFSTKERIPYLTWNIRGELCDWIKKESWKSGINVDVVNGVKDHLHVLIKLKTTQNVAEVVSFIKGGSSKWLNEKYKWEKSFAWQQGYGVFSVSQNDINQVRSYIFNQEKHHKINTYTTEIRELIKKK